MNVELWVVESDGGGMWVEGGRDSTSSLLRAPSLQFGLNFAQAGKVLLVLLLGDRIE